MIVWEGRFRPVCVDGRVGTRELHLAHETRLRGGWWGSIMTMTVKVMSWGDWRGVTLVGDGHACVCVCESIILPDAAAQGAVLRYPTQAYVQGSWF